MSEEQFVLELRIEFLVPELRAELVLVAVLELRIEFLVVPELRAEPGLEVLVDL